MRDFLDHLRRALWRAFQHDAFAVAKGAAYSAILTLFPAVLVVASTLTLSHTTAAFVREISYAVGRILPEGTASAVQEYFEGEHPIPMKFLITTAILTLWTATGVMISWMEGFRNAYQLQKTWGLIQERMVAISLVLMAGGPMAFASFLVAFGLQIENWMIFHAGRELGMYILLMWSLVRWLIATVTSIAVIALIYHNGVPRTQPWHRVLPGAVLATAMWFGSTVLFGWYIRNFAHYDVIYGSVGTAIALLIWLYLISMVVLVGAEFNALRNPRFLFGAHSELKATEVPVEEPAKRK
ncbi:ribonuclease BN, putative [Candidatus Koribacter versatilis Ellin345]|uniref:Ribonuclease BN, putative n=1 Tax=Koribacter versatilis (strain Ellin345) TaxID=204669 RepID=Q1IHI0_KORVE|nr:YihY/virulence factor BrkB family protein [Candidatus Koribacter versatilis]ABF43670.1 ribonuclease BN, putative [Candidatus Koribacter versatilis Ellin345]